jgi:hypothetical protein
MNDQTDLAEKIDQKFRELWPNGTGEIREYLTPFVEAFCVSACCDNHYLKEFLNGNLGTVASRIWEALLFARFQNMGWAVASSDAGPDFLLNDQIYVEAVAAQPGDADKAGLPAEWQNKKSGETLLVPQNEILLRWLSVISVKRKKHLNDINKGHADPNKPFVIAVNSCRLNEDTHGIGGVPLAAMAVLPFGDPSVRIDIASGEVIDAPRLQWRDQIIKPNGEPIRTDSFLNEDYANVSAVIGCSGFYVGGADREKFAGQPPYFIIHNPLARHPLPKPWLTQSIEYIVIQHDDGRVELSEIKMS